MKYSPAPLTPFLAALCIRRRMPILNEQRERKDLDPLTLSTSIACALLNSLAALFATPLICFQSLADSFAKIPGVGYPGRFCGTPAVRHPANSLFTGHESRVTSHDFSTTYKLPPPHHRFSSRAFSSTYELLFSQLACFQKHLRCPLFFSKSIQITGVWRARARGPFSLARFPCIHLQSKCGFLLT
jgi:hypothetical protein